MRIVVRSAAPRPAREAQDRLALAGTAAAAWTGARAATGDGDILILPITNAEDEAAQRAFAREANAEPLAIVEARLWAAAGPATLEQDADFAAAIALDAPPTVLTAQVERIKRRAALSWECTLRMQTAATLAAPVLPLEAKRPLRALYVGAPHPAFLKLEHVLARAEGVVTAAFSSFSGFDHLHDYEFDAVVLNGVAQTPSALSLCAALRRNSALYHMPTLFLAPAKEASVAQSAYERGACAVIAEGEDGAAGLGWLMETVRQERARRALDHRLRALRDLMGDPRTGLFKRPAFETHLEQLANAHHESGRSLSIAALRMVPAHGAREPSADAWRRGFAEVGSLAARLARECDSGAAIGSDAIVIALPCSGLEGARTLAKRVAAVAECTAFAAGEGGAGPLVFEQSAAELQPGESGAALLARALRGVEAESLRA